MKRIITLALLSTVVLPSLLQASEMPAMVGSDIESLEVAKNIVSSVDEGKLPDNVLQAFRNIPKVKLPLLALIEDVHPLTLLRTYLNDHWDERIRGVVNTFLKVLTTTSENSPMVPLAHSIFGEMTTEFTAGEFYQRIGKIYNLFVLQKPGTVSLHINTPQDYVTCQFVGLFLGNWLSRMNVNLNMSDLADPALALDAIRELNGALALNILRLHGYNQADQVKILRSIAEIRPGRAQILIAPEKVDDLAISIKALTDPSLEVFREGRKLDVNVVVNFTHTTFHEDITALKAMFESLVDISVPKVWDLMLRLKNMENVAHSDLTPIIRSVIRSPVASNLCIGTLTPDNPVEARVIETLREEFLAEESKVQMLDFEGSQLSDEGWEQLALLAEAGKSFYKIRLTGMSIPGSIARRLGALRVVGINMTGCGVETEDLLKMVLGWLGDNSQLRGVDLRGNEVEGAVIELFISAGFGVYLEDEVLPHGVIFAKP